jgi:hypothetical protein
MRELVLRILSGLAWLALVLAIALGATGLVNGAAHQPGTPSRAELTYARDREAEIVLEGVSTHLAELAKQVAALGVQARGALAALNGDEIATVEAAIAQGDRLLDELTAQTTALHLELAGVPFVARSDTPLLLSDQIVDQYATLVTALDATAGLQPAWARLTGGSVAAIQLGSLLTQHDREVVEAAALGRAARFNDAMTRLDAAAATISDSRALRDQLANTVDVTVLNQWLDRNAAYDSALRGLYSAYAKAGGTVTTEVEQALGAETAARVNLPPDTRAMVVIMAEIGRGGMNGAVITIEEARGRLTTAVEAAVP